MCTVWWLLAFLHPDTTHANSMPGGHSPIQSTAPVHMCAALVSTGKGHLTHSNQSCCPLCLALAAAAAFLQHAVSQGRLALPAADRRGACSQYACRRGSILHSQMRSNKTKRQQGTGVAAFGGVPPTCSLPKQNAEKLPRQKECLTASTLVAQLNVAAFCRQGKSC